MKPEVSVIVVAYNARPLIGDCLRSLQSQVTSRTFEILVVDSSTDGTGDFVTEMFPNTRLVRSSERKFPGDARNVGIAATDGPIVAFLDADCRAENDWVERIAQAHAAPYPVIGGSIANADPKSCVGWAAYFCEYSHWMPGQEPGWLDDMPTASLSYKREVLEKYGGFIEGTYCSDTELHWRLGRDGHRLRFDSSIRASHQSISDMGRYLRHEYQHGRAFGRIHTRGKNLSRCSRAIKVIGAPLCPLRMLATITRDTIRSRIYVRQFIGTLPLVTLGVISWSVGQVTSYARD